MQNLNEARKSLEELKRENNEIHYLSEYFRANPSLACEANRALIVSFHNGDEITPESIQEAVDFLGDRLAWKDETRVQQDQNARKDAEAIQQQDNRAFLESEIIKLAPHLDKQLKFRSHDELELLLVQLTQARKFRSMSAQEIRSYLQDQRQQAAPAEPLVTVNLTKKELMAFSGSQMRQFLYDAGGRPKRGRDAQGRTIREQVDAILRG